MPGLSAKYTANTGLGLLTTANTGLDGGGTIVTVLVGASNGTLIKTIAIKAQAAFCSGDIVRLFIEDDGVDEVITKLISEILMRPAGGGVSSTFATYGMTVPLNMTLKSGYKLRASTNIAGKISISAEGLDWTYP